MHHLGHSRVLLALGSNLGDRQSNLSAALELLPVWGVHIVACSQVYETAPVGVTDQPSFLNMAAEIETALTPLELLRAAKSVERAIGRTETYRWGPRTVDIDIILWGPCVIREPALQVPHPRFRERGFVLRPLLDIAPEAVDPESGKTVALLWQEFEDGITP